MIKTFQNSLATGSEMINKTAKENREEREREVHRQTDKTI